MSKTILDRNDLLIPLKDFEISQKDFLDVDISLPETVRFFLNSKANVATLVKDSRLQGVISKSDLLTKFSSDIVSNNLNCSTNDYIIKEPFILKTSNTVLDAMLLMLKKEVTSVPVIDEASQEIVKTLDYNDILFWIISKFKFHIQAIPELDGWSYLDSNILEHDFFENEKGKLNTHFFSNKLQKVLIRNTINIDENMSFHEFIKLAKEKKGTAASVTRFETLMVGLLTPNDVFSWLELSNFNPIMDTPVSQIMKNTYVSLMKKHTVGMAVSSILSRNLEYIALMDEDRFPLGVMRAFDLLNYITDALFYEYDDESDLREAS